VERTDTLDWDNFSRVIYTVDHIFHARRDLSVGSRTAQRLDVKKFFYGAGAVALADYAESKLMDFGNTGLSSGDGGQYEEKTFRTSHGGIGGEVLSKTWFGTPVADDTSCAVTLFNRSAAQKEKSRVCLSESVEADRYIRNSARKLGVGI
jgi:hypothetical protein